MTASAPLGAAGFVRRLRRSEVGVDALTDVALDVLPTVATPGLRLALLDGGEADPVLVVEEAERSVVVTLDELAAQMTRSRVLPSPEGIAAALRHWIGSRPVADASAAVAGVAVLTWADDGQTQVGWTVVVPRDELVLPWHPSPGLDDRALHRTRSAALGRAFDVPLDFSVDGPVAVWWHVTAPLLCTAGLVDPARMRRDAAAAGMDTRDALVVVSPGRPVTCANPSVARRLTGETAEPAVLLPWRALPDLSWA